MIMAATLYFLVALLLLDALSSIFRALAALAIWFPLHESIGYGELDASEKFVLRLSLEQDTMCESEKLMM